MTKFEEVLRKIKPRKKFLEFNAGITYWYCLSDLVQKFGNWHSDEQFQKLLEQNADWSQECKNINQINSQLTKENEDLKSQLQQQALPVVPECVAVGIESLPDDYSAFEAISLINAKIDALPEENKDWLPVFNWLCDDIKNQDIFALAFITGKYQVEKPQLFYLKHIDMSKSDAHLNWYLAKGTDNVLKHQGIKKGKLPKLKCILKFTQQEIDSMETGSYEQIKVEDD